MNKLMRQAFTLAGIFLVTTGCQPFASFDELEQSSLTLPKEPATKFSVKKNVLRSISYQAKVNKLNYVFKGLSSHDLRGVTTARIELGHYDFANGISPDEALNKEKSEIWLSAIFPICDSNKAKSLYPFPNKAEVLIETSFGRDINAADRELVAMVSGINTSNSQRSVLLCLAVIGSLEFLSL